MSALWAAVLQGIEPLGRNSLLTEHSAQQSPTNGRVDITITATHDGVNYTLFASDRLMQQIRVDGNIVLSYCMESFEILGT